MDTIPSSRHIKVVIDGVTVADTHRAVLLFETDLPTRYYIPSEDVRKDLLHETELNTSCPYKGIASYWSVATGNKIHNNVVWGYPEPIPEIPKIKGLLSFKNEKLDVYLDGELEVKPQTAWSK